MPNGEKIQELACAAGYLCSAHEELLSAGYTLWSNELRQLIEILAAEMAWLERDVTVSLVPREGTW